MIKKIKLGKESDTSETADYGETIIRILKRHADFGHTKYELLLRYFSSFRLCDGQTIPLAGSFEHDWKSSELSSIRKYIISKVENLNIELVENDKEAKMIFTW
jgi:hypothetical protein